MFSDWTKSSLNQIEVVEFGSVRSTLEELNNLFSLPFLICCLITFKSLEILQTRPSVQNHKPYEVTCSLRT